MFFFAYNKEIQSKIPLTTLSRNLFRIVPIILSTYLSSFQCSASRENFVLNFDLISFILINLIFLRSKEFKILNNFCYVEDKLMITIYWDFGKVFFFKLLFLNSKKECYWKLTIDTHDLVPNVFFNNMKPLIFSSNDNV